LADGWSVFYVARNGHGEPELRCKYRAAGGWGADAVVAGVDGFQVLYGLDTDAIPDGVANRYVNASAIAALDAALVPGASAFDSATGQLRRSHWNRVVSVKVALLLRGAQAGQGARADATYDLFGSVYGGMQGAIDRGTRLAEADLAADAPVRERRLFASTFVLRGPAPRLE
jgi:type IV pilus assembly protein PilW